MDKKWWKEAVVYQIYPRSFMDSNGDGIGDLNGITSRLDYLKDLGVDVIWLSPVYQSPNDDNGYDISDYRAIMQEFGTMEDFDRMLSEMHKRGIRLVMDLVVNHTSDEHKWFVESRKSKDNPYRDYYIWRDAKEGKEPNNWGSCFSGSAWKYDPQTEMYYLHLFSTKQPDLNWENPEVREEVYKNINWWLDKGLGGFRIDAIINIKKALPMHDYEPDREDGLCSIRKMLKEAKGIGDFLGEMRDRTFKKYDAFSVGEVFDEKDEEIPDFIGDNGYFSSMFDFEETIWGASDKGWYDCKQITPDAYKKCCFTTQRKIGDIGFVSNIIENHDEPRGVSRYIPEGDCCDASKKMLGGLNFMLRGLPFIYQGQELGMENVKFESIDQVDDISSLDEYKVALEAGCTPEEALKAVSRFSRDNARTPMQWTDGENAGFTTGKPWLKVNANYTKINAESQMNDPESVRSFYKKLIALRKDPEYKETVVYGELEPVWEDVHNLMAYYRKGDKTLLVVGNYQKEPQTIELAGECKKVLINNYDNVAMDGNKIELQGYQFLVIEM